MRREVARHVARRRTVARLREVARLRDDSGDSAVGFVIAVPAFVLMLSLVILAGRLSFAHGTIESAAGEAARAASLARTADAGDRAAAAAAATTLTNSGTECRRTSVHTVRGAGAVTVTVSCEVDLAGLGLPIPATRTITATGTSAIDVYREGS